MLPNVLNFNVRQMTALLMGTVLFSMLLMPGCSFSASAAVNDLNTVVTATEGIVNALPQVSATIKADVVKVGQNLTAFTACMSSAIASAAAAVSIASQAVKCGASLPVLSTLS